MAGKTDQDKQWLRTLLKEHEGPLLRYGRKITGNLEEAQEVVQEAFLKLWDSNLEKVRGYAVAWLYTVCRNAALDRRRRAKKMTSIDDETSGINLSVQPHLEELLMRNQVLKSISELPPKQQEVLLLKFQDGLSYKEISEVTGQSLSNVGYIIHDGVKILKQTLNKEASND